jgi:predicted AAA+ superfamily ATPase
VRALRQVGDLSQFHAFLITLAARTSQLLNHTALARTLGVAVNTIRAWISVLEATHQIVLPRPFHTNIGKRLAKRPKLYFTDTGLVCHLVGLRTPEHAARGVVTVRADLGDQVLPGYVVHTGHITLPLAPGVRAIPFFKF